MCRSGFSRLFLVYPVHLLHAVYLAYSIHHVLQMGGIVDVEHDLALEHAFSRFHADGTYIDLGIIVDFLKYDLRHARTVEAGDGDSCEEADAVVLFPFRLDQQICRL